MTTHEHRTGRPNDVLRATETDFAGDAADQAGRLSMIMEAEAVDSALCGSSGEGSLDGYSYPLEDTEEVLSMEEAQDGSDDPRHAGDPASWQSPEESAMHLLGTVAKELELTPEDETLLGMDPYDD